MKPRMRMDADALAKQKNPMHISGQFIINPKPELRPCWVGFPYYSLPFGVTNRRFGRYKLPRYIPS